MQRKSRNYGGTFQYGVRLVSLITSAAAFRRQHVAKPEIVRLTGRFFGRIAAKFQTERGVEFPKRCSCAIELLHQRVLRRSVKVSVGSHGGEVIDHCWGNSNILASILPSNFKLE